jgi:uncharacterized cupredoxin-like copper-binding protein
MVLRVRNSRLNRLRGRRGALSVLLVLVIVAAGASLPVAARYGAIPGISEVEQARGIDAARVYENLTISDVSPGFDPDSLVVVAGTPLAFNITNVGSTNHTFSLYALPNETIPCGAAETPANVTSYFQQNGSLINAALTPGESYRTNLTFNFSAVYEFVSLTPYECQDGFNGLVHVLPPGSHSQQELYTNATSSPSLSFVPNILTAQAGIPIVFQVGTSGGHTFTLDGTSNDSSVTPGTNLPSAFPSSGGTASAGFPVNLNLPNPGQTYVSSPVILKPGIYWFVCVIPGHFAAGMWGKIYVSISVSPAALTPAISNVVQYAYLGVAAVIIGGAAFLILMGMSEPVQAATLKEDRAPEDPPSHA